MTSFICSFSRMAAIAVAFPLFLSLGQATAGSINYGDFLGGTVMYLNVTETANTPDDDEPMFGAPSIVGNQLDFDPAGFSAAAGSGSSDITDGQLNLQLRALPGSTLQSVSIAESGDYSLAGTGAAATSIAFGIAIGGARVFEVDGVALSTPIALGAFSISGSDDLGDGAEFLKPWSLSVTYDIGAALAAAGVPFRFGATLIELAIDNSLVAISEAGSIAFIAKKDFTLSVATGNAVVPLPLPALLLGSALFSLIVLGRRRS